MMSGKKKKELWLRLHNYHFEHVVPPHLTDHVAALFAGSDAFTEAFASKIARKLHWTRDNTLRAIAEYKRFVFLGIVSDDSVTPPRIIDKVWHEHLLFSRAYRQFCSEVLRQDFDHNPELVPTDKQTNTFQAQYDRTLARYREEFGEDPPDDIWGTPKFKSERRSREASAVNDSSYVYVDGGSGSGSSEPLHKQFNESDQDSGLVHSDSTHHHAGHGHEGSSSGGGIFDGLFGGDSAGDSGGDGGGSDGGGSGCSSSCGGGGCGS